MFRRGSLRTPSIWDLTWLMRPALIGLSTVTYVPSAGRASWAATGAAGTRHSNRIAIGLIRIEEEINTRRGVVPRWTAMVAMLRGASGGRERDRRDESSGGSPSL